MLIFTRCREAHWCEEGSFTVDLPCFRLSTFVICWWITEQAPPAFKFITITGSNWQTFSGAGRDHSQRACLKSSSEKFDWDSTLKSSLQAEFWVKAKYQCESETYSSCQSRCLVSASIPSFGVFVCLHVNQNVGLHFSSTHRLLLTDSHESDAMEW